MPGWLQDGVGTVVRFVPQLALFLVIVLVGWLLPKLFIALVIVVVGSAIAGAVGDLIRGAMGGLGSARIVAAAAQVFIIALAVIAALNQMGIAVTVTMPVLIAVLATVAGIAIVGVGGGLIMPMRQRWERWLTSAEREGMRMREQRGGMAGEPATGPVTTPAQRTATPSEGATTTAPTAASVPGG